MRSFLLRPGFALAATALLVPLAGNGACGSKTACFTFSQSELAANGDSCPAPQAALSQLSDPNCPGPVVAVNGPGQFDGELCCYPVTFEDVTPACANGGSGSGGEGGSPSCGVTCADALMDNASPCSGAAIAAFASVQQCAGCGGASTQSACTSECQSACGSLASTPACLACLQSKCPAPLSECMSE